MRTIKVLYGQTFFDIAIQYLGDASRVFEIANLNNQSITSDLVAGEWISIPDYEPDKKDIVQEFSNPQNFPATGDTQTPPELSLEGIDYWAIELDFIVS